MAECRQCGAAVFWVFDADGRSVGLDRKPSPVGEIGIDDAGVAQRGKALVRSSRRGLLFKEHKCEEGK